MNSHQSLNFKYGMSHPVAGSQEEKKKSSFIAWHRRHISVPHKPEKMYFFSMVWLVSSPLHKAVYNVFVRKNLVCKYLDGNSCFWILQNHENPIGYCVLIRTKTW
ncbi:hypothetical protein NE237_015435 [Protea cynaroides]|uniref:Uncharacterized protein n=1 Tax=Protea cynaroides TaxID=273540 RepID=A0A9Q0KE19_9MAGN|nr:hypothetical protein NE237_015435 [Protea cynaroides]